MELSISLTQSQATVGLRRSSNSGVVAVRLLQNAGWPFFSVTQMQKSIERRSLQSSPIVHKVYSYHKQEAPLVEGRSMDEVYDALVERLLYSATTAIDHNIKYLVGLAGPPGAGKSTLATEVVQRLNNNQSVKRSNSSTLSTSDGFAIVLPMDGFHLYRSQLDAMEDPVEAHARRGAPWTFNPEMFLKCLRTLKDQGSVFAPSFDHGIGDPVEDDIFVSPEDKVVIVEGNYLFLEEGAWQEISNIFDEKWFLDIDIDTAMRRVLKRHISTGKKPDIAQWRVDYNDRPNAELILRTKKNADLIIRSVDSQ